MRQNTLKLSRRYGVALSVESILLSLAWWLLRRDEYGGEYLAAMACGLQNAMVSSYSGAVVRTTHMTGIITDLGITLGHAVSGIAIDRRRAALYTLLLAGFFSGGICGRYGYIKFGFNTLLLPALFTGVAAGLAICFGAKSAISPAKG